MKYIPKPNWALENDKFYLQYAPSNDYGCDGALWIYQYKRNDVLHHNKIYKFCHIILNNGPNVFILNEHDNPIHGQHSTDGEDYVYELDDQEVMEMMAMVI